MNFSRWNPAPDGSDGLSIGLEYRLFTRHDSHMVSPGKEVWLFRKYEQKSKLPLVWLAKEDGLGGQLHLSMSYKCRKMNDVYTPMVLNHHLQDSACYYERNLASDCSLVVHYTYMLCRKPHDWGWPAVNRHERDYGPLSKMCICHFQITSLHKLDRHCTWNSHLQSLVKITTRSKLQSKYTDVES